MHFIPGLRLRVDEETEIVGIDQSDMGEFAYDYVGLELELKPSAYAISTSAIVDGDGRNSNTEMKETNSS